MSIFSDLNLIITTNPMHKKYRTICGIDVCYYESAEKFQACIFFLHGNKLSGKSFKNFLSSGLAREYTLIVLDLPGFGESAVPIGMKDQITWNFTKEVIVQFIESFNFHSIILCGHSLGGNLAIECIPNIKNCIGLITLCAPPLDSMQAATSAYLPNEHGAKSFIPLLSRQEMQGIAHELSQKASNRDILYEMVEKVDRETVATLYESFSIELINEIEIINKLSFPYLDIQLSDDPFVNHECYRKSGIHNIFGKKPLILHGSGHVPHLDYPDKVALEIDKYISHLLK